MMLLIQGALEVYHNLSVVQNYYTCVYNIGWNKDDKLPGALIDTEWLGITKTEATLHLGKSWYANLLNPELNCLIVSLLLIIFVIAKSNRTFLS